MPTRPGIHISDPATFQDDGDDEYAKKSAAERIAEMRQVTDEARSRRARDARKPKTIGDLDATAIYAKFNSRKPAADVPETDDDND